MLLVEAKAHHGELSSSGKKLPDPRSVNSQRNHEKIGNAIREASDALNTIHPGFALSRDRCYQLSNRFAWAWKVASLGVPVVLVYLGIEDAPDWEHRFGSAASWEQTLAAHGRGIIPEDIWGKIIDTGPAPVIPLIRTAKLDWKIH